MMTGKKPNSLPIMIVFEADGTIFDRAFVVRMSVFEYEVRNNFYLTPVHTRISPASGVPEDQPVPSENNHRDSSYYNND